MTFVSGMKSVLRQDLDIIMVGEIRDRETANMAIQASLTGHLVFSTLHTNDAASAITRLLDLGAESYLIASSLVASLAQRLVCQLCTACKRIADDGTASPVGCDQCRRSGFRGRIGLFELLVTSDQICERIQSREYATQIRQCAVESGMTRAATLLAGRDEAWIDLRRDQLAASDRWRRHRGPSTRFVFAVEKIQ